MRHPQDGTGLSFQQTDHYERPTWPEEPGLQQKMLHREVQVTPSSGADGYSDADGQKALEAAVALAVSVGGSLAEPQARDHHRGELGGALM